MIKVLKGEGYTEEIDKGHGKKVARVIRTYAKNITNKQVKELNKHINGE